MLEHQQEQLTNEFINLPVLQSATIGYRVERNGEEAIVLHDRKQFKNNERATVAIVATNLFGWHNNLMKCKKKCIVLAACFVLSYDLGFKKVIGCQSLERWLKEIEDVVRNRNAKLALNIKHKGRAGTSYTDQTTRAHPMYLHEMF